MTDKLRQLSRRATLKGGMLLTGALAAGVSAVAWVVQACSSGSSGGYGYGGDPYGINPYGYGSSLVRPSRRRWAAKDGPRRIVGG